MINVAACTCRSTRVIEEINEAVGLVCMGSEAGARQYNLNCRLVESLLFFQDDITKSVRLVVCMGVE